MDYGNAGEQSRVLGPVIDYLHAELLRKDLKEHAEELYQEVLALINKYSAAVTSSKVQETIEEADSWKY